MHYDRLLPIIGQEASRSSHGSVAKVVGTLCSFSYNDYRGNLREARENGQFRAYKFRTSKQKTMHVCFAEHNVFVFLLYGNDDKNMLN
jgi:hypothetical protein